MRTRCLFLFRLGCHSKQAGNECHLREEVSLVDSSHLLFPDHVHDFIALEGSPCRVKRKEAESWFEQLFDEPMILFNDVVEVFDLPKFTPFVNNVLSFEFAERFWEGGVFVYRDHPRRDRMGSLQGREEELLCRFCISRGAEQKFQGVVSSTRQESDDPFLYRGPLPLPLEQYIQPKRRLVHR